MRLRTDQRLRRQADFARLRSDGLRRDCGAFTLWAIRRDAAEKPADVVRAGVVASRASVGDAVRRNRAKRRLREVFRRNQQLVPPGFDLLLVARRSLNGLEYAEIERKFVDACRKLFPSKPTDA